jgi:hypothetical protein
MAISLSNLVPFRLWPLATPLLCWPAFWNCYPLVFADTGTYISQASLHYLGWDRPIFYSASILALHWRISLWPVVVAQALGLVAATRLTLAVMRSAAFWPAILMLSTASALPLLASEIMPDATTGVLVLLLGIIVVNPVFLSDGLAWGLTFILSYLIVCHLSHLPIALALSTILLPLFRPALGVWLRLMGAVTIAISLLVSVNLMGFHRVSIAPFGDAFLLARLQQDGPALAVLDKECALRGWQLCRYRDSLPMLADDFLWHADSPLALAGGPRRLSDEISSIVAVSVHDHPIPVVQAVMRNFRQQLVMAHSADGLTSEWNAQVTPWMRRVFPRRELIAYLDSRQSTGRFYICNFLLHLHAWIAMAASVVCLHTAWRGRALAMRVLATATLLALPVNALVTGALSGPHDRYQSRVLWPLIVVAAGTLPWRRVG